MKHAGKPSLRSLGTLLNVIRKNDELKEKKPGIFYKQSKAFLHFHEDPSGMFADLKTGTEFERFPVNTEKERKEFILTFHRIVNSQSS